MSYLPSIWERLIFDSGDDFSSKCFFDIDQLKKSVAKDLEHLLNSRQPFGVIGSSFPHVQSSVAMFGAPDFSNRSLSSSVDQYEICQGMARAIELFDPRLSSVKIQLRSQGAEVHKLAFDINAVLRAADRYELVNFDALFESAGMLYAVKS